MAPQVARCSGNAAPGEAFPVDRQRATGEVRGQDGCLNHRHGAVLFNAATLQPVQYWADCITAQDEIVWRAERNVSKHMALWELLAIVVSVRVWAPFLRGDLAEIRVQADSLAALGAAVKLTSPVPVLNELAMELALALESIGAEVTLGEHIRGILNVEADALSRWYEGAELPARLRCVPRTLAPARHEAWYKALGQGRADDWSAVPEARQEGK